MSDSHFLDGYRLLQEGNLDDAVVASPQTRTQEPGWAEAHYNLGNAYTGLRYDAFAVRAHREAARLNPFLNGHRQRFDRQYAFEALISSILG